MIFWRKKAKNKTFKIITIYSKIKIKKKIFVNPLSRMAILKTIKAKMWSRIVTKSLILLLMWWIIFNRVILLNKMEFLARIKRIFRIFMRVHVSKMGTWKKENSWIFTRVRSMEKGKIKVIKIKMRICLKVILLAKSNLTYWMILKWTCMRIIGFMRMKKYIKTIKMNKIYSKVNNKY